MKSKTQKILAALEKKGFTPIDVQYLRGYFIFEFGEDMVVHFRLKECKGWLFGIWWDVDESKYDFFAQYEKNINKFKPSDSSFVEKSIWFEEDAPLGYCADGICQFIKKHPLKAWYADGCYFHNLWAIYPRFLFLKFVKERWRDDCYYQFRKNRLNKKYLRLLEKVCQALLIDYEIIDWNKDGAIHWPRWSIRAKDFKNEHIEEGRWVLSLDDIPSKLAKKCERFNEKLEKLNRRYRPFTNDVSYINETDIVIRRHSSKLVKESE